jgi:hypothetical protein
VFWSSRRKDLPHFSFGSDLREWTDKDVNWFRTSIAEGNVSYRAIEALSAETQQKFVSQLSGVSSKNVIEHLATLSSILGKAKGWKMFSKR